MTKKELRFERSIETKSIELEGLIDRGLWVGAGGYSNLYRACTLIMASPRFCTTNRSSIIGCRSIDTARLPTINFFISSATAFLFELNARTASPAGLLTRIELKARFHCPPVDVKTGEDRWKGRGPRSSSTSQLLQQLHGNL